MSRAAHFVMVKGKQTKKLPPGMEADSDSDSDYDISKDAAADKEDAEMDAQDQQLEAMGAFRMKKATSAWEEMNLSFSADVKSRMDNSVAMLVGKERQKIKEGKPKGTTSGKGKDGKKKAEKASKKMSKMNSVLAGIFGKQIASTMVLGGAGMDISASSSSSSSSSAGGGKGKTAKSVSGSSNKVSSEAKSIKSAELRARALAATKGLVRKELVVETRKFAGREITVERTVGAGEKALMPVAPKEATSGISKVLADIKGPKAVSTVAKSSMDWDNYKEEEGINDELSKVTKDGQGLLGKRDFLNRCDTRAFEQERDVRLSNAAKNVAPGKK
jgi:hypothetical protein